METALIDIKAAKFVGMQEKPDFIFSSMSYKAGDNVYSTMFFNELLNKKIYLKNYSKNEIKHITFTFIIYPVNYSGVNRSERKYYKRSEKHFFIDIKVNEYEDFCNAEPLLAKEILKTHLLRAVKKFLQTQKDFNFPLFLKDLEEVL